MNTLWIGVIVILVLSGILGWASCPHCVPLHAVRIVHAIQRKSNPCKTPVLTTEQVDRAVDAGAKFIVSPGLNPKVVRYCIEKGVTNCVPLHAVRMVHAIQRKSNPCKTPTAKPAK